jgi:hypothetical protein
MLKYSSLLLKQELKDNIPMATKHDFHMAIIGRSEVMTFVGTEAVNVPAKTDTGAYRSAVHATNIKVRPDGVLEFLVLGDHPVCGAMAHIVTSKEYKKVVISNSFGHEEERFEVKLKVKLGSKVFHAQFTLADRSKKIYPILLGRKLLNHRFLVDSSQTRLDRALLKKEYGIEFPDDEEEGR